jgi:predicted MFS family arabinose efflux permease
VETRVFSLLSHPPVKLQVRHQFRVKITDLTILFQDGFFLANIVNLIQNSKMQFLSPANTYILIKTMYRSFVSLFFVLYFPYLLSFGLSNFQINFINAIFFHLVIFGFDIPTGLFADFFGKKISAIIGFFAYACGVLIYSIGSSFWYFAVAELLLAIGTAFVSGSFLSWMIEMVGKDEFQKVEGNSEFWVSIFSFAAVSLSGVLSFYYGFKPVLVIESLGIFVTGFLALILMQKDLGHHEQTKTLANIKISSKAAWKSARENKSGITVAIFNSIALVGIMAMFIYWQPIFLELGLSQQYAGILFGCFGIAMGFGSKYISQLKIENHLNLFYKILFLTGVVTLVSTTLLPISLIGSIVFFLCFELLVGARLILSTMIYNQNIDEKNRAAVNSIYSTIEKVGSTLGLLLIGYLADVTSRSFTWYLAAGIFFIISMFGLLSRSKKNV